MKTFIFLVFSYLCISMTALADNEVWKNASLCRDADLNDITFFPRAQVAFFKDLQNLSDAKAFERNCDKDNMRNGDTIISIGPLCQLEETYFQEDFEIKLTIVLPENLKVSAPLTREPYHLYFENSQTDFILSFTRKTDPQVIRSGKVVGLCQRRMNGISVNEFLLEYVSGGESKFFLLHPTTP